MTQIGSSQVGANATCPVHNFNYTDNKPAGTWFATYDELREESPIYRNEFGPGWWTVLSYEGILEVLQNPAIYSNSVVTPLDPEPAFRWIPEMLDGEEHRQWRKQLAPLFSPKVTDALEDKVRARAVDLIEAILAKGTGKADLMTEFAQKYPTTIFLELMGLPVDELGQFMEWVHAILHNTNDDVDRLRQEQGAAMMAVMGRFATIIAERREEPRDDIVSKALTFRIDDKPVSDQDLLAFCLLMFMAGLDTVSVTLGWSFWHLATHPEDRAAIVADPQIIPTAVEEFVRAYAIVVPARKAMQDTVLEGCPIKAGDIVGFPLSAATRDEAAFHDPTKVDIHRTANNHIGFGAGPHRCLGSHLARRELRIAIEEWHKRVPDYRLAPDAELTETGGQLGLTSLPLEWDPA
ncbi:cytochrome P450 [Nocardia nova]|uniref:Cytochrome P450 n=1 Tax=Nocardia nova TaxID=37330 RepID=A0A2S6ATG9_9NOCA|nr:cytochrome P450 [Nocardia nova]PPJ23950.1 cytochrome P450 [Nocardia nova]PPJ38562.1 cytochrome P450 [Nocardia nova]